MRITVDHAPHEVLLSDVETHLYACGFASVSSAYHDVMHQDAQDRLRFIYSPTALYLRARADRSAIHIDRDVVFEWDAKTSTREHMALEMLPAAHHKAKARFPLRVKSLYCFRNGTHDVGFWFDAMPPVRVIFMPLRYDNEFFRGVADEYFPGVDVVPRNSRGSGDPFLIIDQSELCHLPHWRDCIDDAISEGG